MEADYLAQKHVELWNIFNRKINKWFMYIAVLYCKIENKYLITEWVYFSSLLLLWWELTFKFHHVQWIVSVHFTVFQLFYDSTLSVQWNLNVNVTARINCIRDFLIVIPDKCQHLAVYKYSLSEQTVLVESYRLLKHILCTLNFFIIHGFWDDCTKERLCVHIQGLSGKCLSILNISRTSCVALISLGSQSEETFLHILEQSLFRVASQSAVRRRWLTLCTEYCVTVAFKITKRADQLHHDNAPGHSAALMQAFSAKHHIAQVCQTPYSPDLAPCEFWLFPKLKSSLNGRRFMNATVTQYTRCKA